MTKCLHVTWPYCRQKCYSATHYYYDSFLPLYLYFFCPWSPQSLFSKIFSHNILSKGYSRTWAIPWHTEWQGIREQTSSVLASILFPPETEKPETWLGTWTCWIHWQSIVYNPGLYERLSWSSLKGYAWPRCVRCISLAKLWTWCLTPSSASRSRQGSCSPCSAHMFGAVTIIIINIAIPLNSHADAKHPFPYRSLPSLQKASWFSRFHRLNSSQCCTYRNGSRAYCLPTVSLFYLSSLDWTRSENWCCVRYPQVGEVVTKRLTLSKPQIPVLILKMDLPINFHLHHPIGNVNGHPYPIPLYLHPDHFLAPQ